VSRRAAARTTALTALAAVAIALFAAPGAGAAVTLPEHFEDQTVWSGLESPTIVKFAPNGEIFVGEKSGKILVFENLEDKTPEVFANLSKPIYDYEDHGLLGLAIDPLFELGRPYVYALYTYNHELADKGAQEPTGVEPHTVTPRWPSAGPGYENDQCQESEEVKRGEKQKEALGCEVSGVLVRLTAEGNHAKPAAGEPEEPEEKVLLEGWCQQATTHSIGDLGFGPEGDLFVSGGEGAMYSEADYGQFGNPCEDPVEEENGEVVRLTSLGGSLRSQSVLREHPAYPTLLSGSVLRINPDTGEGVAGNPFYAEPEKNAKRIIGFGFRQPWRFTVSERLGEVFVSNVGNGSYEEVERLQIGSADKFNGGWPCYEGSEEGKPARNYTYSGEYEDEGKEVPYPSIQYCIDQYEAEENGEQETETPFYAYPHNGPVVPGDRCYHGTALATDVAGNAFYEGSAWPAAYHDAFFFADAIRGCIYMMQAGANGEPDPATGTTFLSGSEAFSFPGVDIEQGPEGNLFYVELYGAGGGSIHRIVYQPPKPPEEEGKKETPPPPGPTPTPPPTYSAPSLKKRPGSKTTSRSAKFAFSGDAGVKFMCKLDNKKFSSCKSPRTYKNLKPGKHTFRVYEADASGTRLSKNRAFTWNIVRKS
jgi:glucose/arabinose dehydrogenase